MNCKIKQNFMQKSFAIKYTKIYKLAVEQISLSFQLNHFVQFEN